MSIRPAEPVGHEKLSISKLFADNFDRDCIGLVVFGDAHVMTFGLLEQAFGMGRIDPEVKRLVILRKYVYVPSRRSVHEFFSDKLNGFCLGVAQTVLDSRTRKKVCSQAHATWIKHKSRTAVGVRLDSGALRSLAVFSIFQIGIIVVNRNVVSGE